MRREVALLSVIALGPAISSCGAPPKPPPPCPSPKVCMVPPRSVGPEIGGCENPGRGAALVKVHVTLGLDSGDKCVVEQLRPRRVCVTQGGVVRWKIHNKCKLPPSPEGVFRITKIGWLECDPRLMALEEMEHPKNQLLCGVPDGQTLGEYEYGVDGEGVEPFDPWIEVRGGG